MPISIDAVIGEQVRRLAPQAAVDVVAEGALQLLDGARALELLDAGRQRIDLRVDARSLGVGGLRKRDGKADQDDAFHGFHVAPHCVALRSRMNFIHSSDVGMTGKSTRRRIFHWPSSRINSSS